MRVCIAPFVMALLLAGCTRGEVEEAVDPGPGRVEAWATVESYKIDQRVNTLRHSEWLREPDNAGKSREEAEAALGLEQPNPLPAVDAALQIAEADPTDDLGFLALRFGTAWCAAEHTKWNPSTT